jgi:nuclear pore complex protein Nup107
MPHQRPRPRPQKNELNLHRALFELVRRGKLNEAADLCEAHDHPWKAATLMGGLLWQCDLLDGTGNSNGARAHEPGFSGNQHRATWKFACSRLAAQEGCDLYERAIYGYLCGDSGPVLPVCQTWEDVLWIHLHALVEYRMDARLRPTAAGEEEEALSLTLPPPKSPEAILQSLLKREGTQAAANDPFRIIQAHMILDRFPDLFRRFCAQLPLTAAAAAAGAEASPAIPNFPRILRFLTHLILLLQGLGYAVASSDDCNLILCKYVDLLIQQGCDELVALYCFYLPPPQQVEYHANFLASKCVRGAHLRGMGLGEGRGVAALCTSPLTCRPYPCATPCPPAHAHLQAWRCLPRGRGNSCSSRPTAASTAPPLSGEAWCCGGSPSCSA